MFFRNKYNFNVAIKILTPNKLLSIIILFQIIVFVFLYKNGLLTSPDLYTSDAYSFYHNNYSNLENLLSQYRSFGGPLYVKFYKIFSLELKNWGMVNYILFSISLILFFHSLILNNFNKIFSFFLILGILGSTKLWYYFSYWSEVFSVTLILFTTSLYFFSYKYKKNYQYFLFTIFLFYTYQVRPLFVIFVFTFILLEFYFIKFDKKEKIFNIKNLKIANFTLLPLIFFLIIRYSITGHLGIAPYVGAHVGAHALFYLNENNINLSSEKNKDFAKKIYKRKLAHNYPCNSDYSEIKELSSYTLCYTENTMSLMLEMIKDKTNKQPFKDGDERNYNSWKYMITLDKFFIEIKNYNEIDKSLQNFSEYLIKLNFKNFLNQAKLNFYKSYSMQVSMNKKLIYIYIITIIILFSIFLINKKSILKSKDDLIKLNGILIFFLLTNFLSIIILSVIHLPKMRLMSVQGIFFVPVIFSYIIGYLTNIFENKK